MSHLAIEALLDLAEGTRAGSEAAHVHLESCGACRDRLADVRAAMAAVLEPVDRDVPEPSPLFWEYFSMRIHEAVASEAVPHRTDGMERWLERWLSLRMVLPAAACLVALLAVAVALRSTSGRSVPVAPPTATTTPLGAVADAVSPVTSVVNVVDVASWNLMTDLAGDLDWDAAVDAGLTPPAGGVDRALFDLSGGERRELQRLLTEELSRSGA